MRNILTGILILLFFISGCADKTPQPQTAKPAKPQAAKPTAEKPSDAVPAAPSVKGEVLVPIGYEYHSQGRRDPFQSLIIKDVLEKKKGTTPLEQDELSALRLTAIIWSGTHYHAMITLPDGKSYTVRKGMRIGLDGGTVENITKDSVIVRQHIKDKKGVPKPKDLILKLRTEEEG